MPESRLGETTERAFLAEHLAWSGGRLSEVYLMLTMGCNLRCRACSLWGVGGACHDAAYLMRTSKTVPLARIMAMLEAVSRRGVGQVTLSGGEPLMTRRWKPLARKLRELGIKAALTTNATLLERHAEDVAELFDQVNVSVAVPPDLRENLRAGPPGHWEEMIAGLRRLNRLRRSSGRKLCLRLLCEVFDFNACVLDRVIQSLEDAGVCFDEVFIQHLIFNRSETLRDQQRVLATEFGSNMGLWRGYGYAPRAMDFKAFDAALVRVRRRWPQAVFSVDLRGHEALRTYYEGDRTTLGRAWCAGPWTQVNLLPNGEVWSCPDVSLGSIAERGFDEIWDGAAARALRRRVARRLLPACRGCFYFYGDGHFPRRLADA
ncbi:MAG: radical SAM protein [Elusimicrobiota bacterium]